MTNEELDLVETNDLIAALQRRTATGVVLLLDRMEADTQARKWMFWGGLYTATGMCQVFQRYLQELASKQNG